MAYGQVVQQKNSPVPYGAAMKTITTRFGEVEYGPANLLHFPEGLIGFESLRDFIVVPSEKLGPLFWVQSVDDPEVSFLLTDPTNFFLDYKVVSDKGDCAKLGIARQEDSHTLSVVTIQRDKSITLNLQAPVLFAPETNIALQVILDKTTYSTREALPQMEKQ